MKPNSSTIKAWAEEDRPREKMLAKGKEALSDAELVAILLGSGNSEETAVDLARHVLKDVGDNLINLSKLSIKELMAYRGIGEAKAVTIAAALELGRRRRFAETASTRSIRNSRDAFEHFYLKMSDLTHEQFWIMMLNHANNIIKIEQIGVGGLSSTIADPKKIFKAAIENQASAVMLCHNHPSGNLEPSNNDRKLTKNIVNGAKYFDIKILDHIIIGINNYYSFADSGEL